MQSESMDTIFLLCSISVTVFVSGELLLMCIWINEWTNGPCRLLDVKSHLKQFQPTLDYKMTTRKNPKKPVSYVVPNFHILINYSFASSYINKNRLFKNLVQPVWQHTQGCMMYLSPPETPTKIYAMLFKVYSHGQDAIMFTVYFPSGCRCGEAQGIEFFVPSPGAYMHLALQHVRLLLCIGTRKKVHLFSLWREHAINLLLT